ncbi:2-phosphosulfolactate phosphatase [Actinokineospora globicatena]|uniref:Probable 2-phosphosulfolactate phosphatase n=1 Tax=Actinokineospora globicatena TaxID=103729 RepID=A0A9W6QNP5_9PSEU|nr:2-phosphosulfolactate phosphatase [Actinokineospora globicatena]GLW91753.1 hypothetical protein Aglo03_25690 [Actinokineospora globicatena]
MGKSPYAQDGYRFRFDWGLSGAQEIAEPSWIVAVVDVLSFTTTLTVAVDAGIEVFPYRWRDESAAEFAKEQDAVLAVRRSEPGAVSLSPGTVRNAPDLRRLVLPSPNGSTIAQAMSSKGHDVIGVSLRNTTAAAAWTAERLRTGAAAGVAVVAAGEVWRSTGALRPGAEDLWGAGAFLAALSEHGTFSPEARLAASAFRDVSGDIAAQLHDCASGRELIEMGHRQDVEIAAEIDSSTSVPVLVGLSFRQAR